MIVEGIVDGRQEGKMKTIIPVTNLNLVSHYGNHYKVRGQAG